MADKASLKHTRQKRVHNQRRERTNMIKSLEENKLITGEVLGRIDALLDQMKETPPPAETCRELLQLMQARIVTSPRGQQEENPSLQGKSPAGLSSSASKLMENIIKDITGKCAAKDVDRTKWPLALSEELETYQQALQGQKETIEKQMRGIKDTRITTETCYVGASSSPTNEQLGTGTRAASSLDKKTFSMEKTPSTHKENLDLASAFGMIEPANYRGSQEFICSNRHIVQDEVVLHLLGQAGKLLTHGNEKLAWRHVHQALIIQWCRKLGNDGVAVFFSRITSRHQAQESFLQAVSDQFQQMRAAAAPKP